MVMNKNLSQAIGSRLRKLRLKTQLSQEEFGDMVDADRTYISKIENGTKNLTICKLCSICEKMGITLHDFFNDKSFKGKTFSEKEED